MQWRAPDPATFARIGEDRAAPASPRELTRQLRCGPRERRRPGAPETNDGSISAGSNPGRRTRRGTTVDVASSSMLKTRSTPSRNAFEPDEAPDPSLHFPRRDESAHVHWHRAMSWREFSTRVRCFSTSPQARRDRIFPNLSRRPCRNRMSCWSSSPTTGTPPLRTAPGSDVMPGTALVHAGDRSTYVDHGLRSKLPVRENGTYSEYWQR